MINAGLDSVFTLDKLFLFPPVLGVPAKNPVRIVTVAFTTIRLFHSWMLIIILWAIIAGLRQLALENIALGLTLFPLFFRQPRYLRTGFLPLSPQNPATQPSSGGGIFGRGGSMTAKINRMTASG